MSRYGNKVDGPLLMLGPKDARNTPPLKRQDDPAQASIETRLPDGREAWIYV